MELAARCICRPRPPCAGLKFQNEGLWIFVFLNAFIHTVMYTYYAITAAGVPYPAKPLITAMQVRPSAARADSPNPNANSRPCSHSRTPRTPLAQSQGCGYGWGDGYSGCLARIHDLVSADDPPTLALTHSFNQMLSHLLTYLLTHLHTHVLTYLLLRNLVADLPIY